MAGVLYANPWDSPELYDILITAGVASPGICELTDEAGRIFKWDRKDVAGAQGETITYRGLRGSQFAFKFKFWLKEQLIEFFEKFVPLLSYDGTKTTPKPISVLHPILAANDITSVVVEEIGSIKHDDGKQLWSVTVKFLEYRPAAKKNVTSTPKSTTNAAGAKAVGKPSVLDTQDQQIAALMGQAFDPGPDPFFAPT